ncbi:Alpha/Beta hydrolase protein [Scenedesmus sp. NREL 46B-D3]|nr:Alpha/Beta hydrolase protein [Scenedesmus sp. NREL 46B-D3]
MPREPAVQDLGRAQLHDALKYGMIASAAYLDKEDEVRAKLQAFRGGELGNAPFKIVKHTGTLWKTPLTGRHVATDTEVLCLRLPSASGREDEMVVAFRGTETGGDGAGSDILTDIFALQAHIGDMEGVPAGRHPKNVKVHRGFLTSFNDVVHPTESGSYDAMSDVRDELMGKGVLPARVVVTGHSLGAALATLGAFWLKSIMPSVTVECWAFASPRVGNREFAEAFASTVDSCYRVTHKNDVVPAVPASPFWVHVSQGVLLLEPARNTYGHAVPKAMPPGTRYRAVLGDRPRPGAYASVGDHSMDLYLAAMEDALKARTA